MTPPSTGTEASRTLVHSKQATLEGVNVMDHCEHDIPSLT